MVLLLSVGSAALAQGGGGRRGMVGRGGGGLLMLRLAEVQKELKMTPEQVGKLDAKQAEVRQSMQDAFQSVGGNPAEMSAADRQKLMDKMQAIQSKAVADLLDTTQQKRFRQLELQLQGPSVLAARKDVADELKLTEDQKKQAAEIQAKADADNRAAMQGVDFQSMTQEDRVKMMTKRQDIQKAAGEKIAALLTDAQKAQWKEMLGAPFTFPPAVPGRGFGAR
jgi:hypothetical protein